jgi:hypothetical protein
MLADQILQHGQAVFRLQKRPPPTVLLPPPSPRQEEMYTMRHARSCVDFLAEETAHWLLSKLILAAQVGCWNGHCQLVPRHGTLFRHACKGTSGSHRCVSDYKTNPLINFVDAAEYRPRMVKTSTVTLRVVCCGEQVTTGVGFRITSAGTTAATYAAWQLAVLQN